MRTFSTVAALNDYLAQHGELIILSDERRLTQYDIRLYALVAGDFNPAHCVPGFEQYTLLKGLSSQGSAIITRAEGVFVALKLFDVYPEIIAAGIKDLTYTAPLNVGDIYRYRFTFKNMRKSKRMYKLECQIVCEKFSQETQEWKSITEWLWLPAYADHAECIGVEAVRRLQPKSYTRNVAQYIVLPLALHGVRRTSRLATCAAIWALLFIGVWRIDLRYGTFRAEYDQRLSAGQQTCQFCVDP